MPAPEKPFNSHVHFRMFQMPCCSVLICWVNSRLPNFCSECGQRVYAQVKSGTYTITDCAAWLRAEPGAKPPTEVKNEHP